MNEKTPANLWELHRACNHLLVRTEGMSAEEMKVDYDLSLVIERLFERIGETLSRINASDPESVDKLFDYRRAINLRNIIAHQYYSVDWVKIRMHLDVSIPKLLESVDRLMLEIPEEL